MKRVAVFGNAGAGKSTLARRLAALTRLPLHVIDRMQFRAGGESVPPEDFLKAHADLLDNSPLWSSTMASFRVIPRCHRYLTPKYRQFVADAAATKRIHHLRSRRDISAFPDFIAQEMTGKSL